MLTPKFELTQTETKVCIIVFAPYTNISETEIYVEKNDFRFFSPPYYLRLQLPGEVTEMGASNAVYDADDGKFILTVEKVNRGEHFPNLDLISTLLVKKTKTFPSKPNIRVLDSQGEDGSVDDLHCSVDESSEIDCLIEQTVPEEVPSCEGLISKPQYGFGNQYSDVFKGFAYEVLEILDLPDPDVTPASSRTLLRLDCEREDFSDEHYLADRVYRRSIDEVIAFETVWEQCQRTGTCATLCAEDIERLKDFPVREYILTPHDRQALYFGLFDIIAAYCYDHRTTEGESTSESAWTINKLSATLSWFEVYATLDEAVLAFVRRSLCYPLFRNYDLSVKILSDVQILLRLGKRQLLKCLLDVHCLFNLSNPRYLLNRLYIEDYCVWIQEADDKYLMDMADKIGMSIPTKQDLSLDIVELELAAEMVEKEEEEKQRLQMVNRTLSGLHLSDEESSSSEEKVQSLLEQSSDGNTDDEESLDSDDLSS